MFGPTFDSRDTSTVKANCQPSIYAQGVDTSPTKTSITDLALNSIPILNYEDSERLEAEGLATKDLLERKIVILNSLRDINPSTADISQRIRAIDTRLQFFTKQLQTDAMLFLDAASTQRIELAHNIREARISIEALQGLSIAASPNKYIAEQVTEARARQVSLLNKITALSRQKDALQGPDAAASRGTVAAGEVYARTMPAASSTNTPSTASERVMPRHWSCLVNSYRTFQTAKPLVRVIYGLAIITIVAVAIAALIDLVVLIGHEIKAGFIVKTVTSPDLAVGVRTAVNQILDEQMVNKFVNFGGDVIEGLANKAIVQLVAMVENEEVFRAIEQLAVKMISSKPLLDSIAGMVDSKEIHKAVKKAIGKAGGPALAFLKATISDKELQEMIAAHLTGIVTAVSSGTKDATAEYVSETTTALKEGLKAKVKAMPKNVLDAATSIPGRALGAVSSAGKAGYNGLRAAANHAVNMFGGRKATPIVGPPATPSTGTPADSDPSFSFLYVAGQPLVADNGLNGKPSFSEAWQPGVNGVYNGSYMDPSFYEFMDSTNFTYVPENVATEDGQ